MSEESSLASMIESALANEKPFNPIYFAALGMFVTEFASVEQAIQFALFELFDMSLKEGAAVFSGLRTDAGVSAIKRLYEARNQELPKALNNSFEQLNLINKLRNDILHHGTSSFDNKTMSVSNYLRAHHERKIYTHTVSSSQIINAAQDARRIAHAIFAEFYDLGRQELLDDHKAALNGAWLYKPKQQQTHHHKSRGDRASRKRPPSSSPP